jgi:hypothetical protein
MGRKLCLFVYYVEQIDNKQWMAEEVAIINGGMESRADKKENLSTMRGKFFFFFLICFQRMIGGAC